MLADVKTNSSELPALGEMLAKSSLLLSKIPEDYLFAPGESRPLSSRYSSEGMPEADMTRTRKRGNGAGPSRGERVPFQHSISGHVMAERNGPTLKTHVTTLGSKCLGQWIPEILRSVRGLNSYPGD